MVLQQLSSACSTRQALRFQILSDLHLEVGQQYEAFNIPPKAPYLILAGDIGRLIDYKPLLAFLERQCQNFEKIFYVLGNHEIYGTSRSNGLSMVDDLQRESCLGKRLIILNRESYCFEDEAGPVVLGCTLHSQITAETRAIVKMKIQDFSKIEDWTIDDHNAEHAKDVAWLQSKIHRLRTDIQNRSRPILVITHHAPSTQGTSIPTDAKNPWSAAFATDLLENPELHEFSNVHTWVFGHTHHTMQAKIGGVNVVSNQRGYALPKAPYLIESEVSAYEKLKKNVFGAKRVKGKGFEVGRTIDI